MLTSVSSLVIVMLTFHARGYCVAWAADFLRLRRSFGGVGSQVVHRDALTPPPCLPSCNTLCNTLWTPPTCPPALSLPEVRLGVQGPGGGLVRGLAEVRAEEGLRDRVHGGVAHVEELQLPCTPAHE